MNTISKTASIDINISSLNLSQIIIGSLINHGWNMYDEVGNVVYLPLGDIDEYNWTKDPIDWSTLISIIKTKENQNEHIGIDLTWRETGIGGQFLFWSKGNLSINLNINRKKIDGCQFDITDFSWYLDKIVPALKALEIEVVGLCTEEHI